MVDTINELSDLASKLNKKSDTLNATITTINEKLLKLNLGVEAWLESDPIEVGDPYFDRERDEHELFPMRAETLLGYCKFEDGWKLAAKPTVAQKDSDGYFVTLKVIGVRPLLECPRTVRAKAMRVIPMLLDAIKANAESLLKNIEEAETAAEKL